mmetsp:Transcript_17905/g.26577  ORF Transcript_17905/g.26577 Transcript_17905/m.26577 type:complete len:203 (+) Transcript_17905:78-686(+)
MMASQTIDDEEPNLPLFLGIYSLEVGVQAICISHGLACVILLSLASSVVGVTVMGEFVSPEFQVCLAAWCLLGIGLTAASLVACARKQAYPLQVYFYYLLLTCIALVVLGVHLYQEGADCDMVSRTKTSQRLGISWSCGLVSVTWLLCLGSIFTFFGLRDVDALVLQGRIAATRAVCASERKSCEAGRSLARSSLHRGWRNR